MLDVWPRDPSHRDKSNAGLQTAATLVKTCLAICLVESEHQIVLITIGQFFIADNSKPCSFFS